jgi:hypothetical protein
LVKKLTYFLVFLFCCKSALVAQPGYQLHIINTDSQKIFKKITYKTLFANKEFLQKEVNQVYVALVNEGFITAGIDSLVCDSLGCKAYMVAGQKYKWVKLDYDKKDQAIVSRLGYNEHFFSNRPFKYHELSGFMEKLIVYYENHGYPFATARLDSVQTGEGMLQAKLVIDKKEFLKLDSLLTEGEGKVNRKFLMRYLGIRNGMPYNEAAFRSVSDKIRQLPFVTESRPPVMRLTDKQNKLYLFLDKKNASQFDGIVGILPGDNGKTIFTGDVKIRLVNTIFKSGETFDINWRRLQSQTQDLRAQVVYPYIAGLPLGVDYNIKLYKKDSTFIDVTNGLGLNYYFSGLNFFKVFYKQRNANLIATSYLANATVLPEYADVVTKSYGVGAFIEKFDYKFNPKKGFHINLQGSVGNREIKKNPRINDAVYTTVQLKSTQYQVDGDVVGYIHLVKNHVLKLSAQAGSVFGNVIYRNELFRIGGLRTLRGFDEESIYASSYVIPTVEYRFLFEKNSNIFVFAEGAWYESSSVTGYLTDTPLSVGAGINFETKAGIFNLSYGLGQQMGNSFDLRTGKIHAGLTALF